jgi:hypothetical protein
MLLRLVIILKACRSPYAKAGEGDKSIICRKLLGFLRLGQRHAPFALATLSSESVLEQRTPPSRLQHQAAAMALSDRSPTIAPISVHYFR